jgi:hypothetical protein
MGGSVKDSQGDKEWLHRVYTLRCKAIDRVVLPEMKRIKRKFLAAARRGHQCIIRIRAAHYHYETLAALSSSGFQISPRSRAGRSGNAWTVLEIALPLESEDQPLNTWRKSIREIYFRAKDRVADKQFRDIQQRFERAAKARLASVFLHANFCSTKTWRMLQQRLGCSIEMYLVGSEEYYLLAL